MTTSTSRYNKIVKENTVKTLYEVYLSENTGKGTCVSIQQYLNKGERIYGVVEKIIKKNEKYEIFFKKILVEIGYKPVDGYYRQAGSGPGTWTTRELYTKFLWDNCSDNICSIKNPRIFEIEKK
jgi:hypothetical protein